MYNVQCTMCNKMVSTIGSHPVSNKNDFDSVHI